MPNGSPGDSSRVVSGPLPSSDQPLAVCNPNMTTVSTKINPPAVLEDSRSLTAPGVFRSLPFVNRSKFTKGDRNEYIRESEAHGMGMQISCGVHPKVSEESVVSTVEAGTGNGVSRTGATTGERDYRGAPDGRSCAHVDLDSAEAFGVIPDGVHQRQECDSHRAGVCWAEAQLCGTTLLGARVLGINGGKERSRGAPLHPRAGEGRPTAGPDGVNGALSGTR